MQKKFLSIKNALIVIIDFAFSTQYLYAQNVSIPDTVSFSSGNLTLKALLWHPSGTQVFPAIIFCHGSLGGTDTIHDPLEEASLLGNLFVNNGYIFLAVFRRGAGLSKN